MPRTLPSTRTSKSSMPPLLPRRAASKEIVYDPAAQPESDWVIEPLLLEEGDLRPLRGRRVAGGERRVVAGQARTAGAGAGEGPGRAGRVVGIAAPLGDRLEARVARDGDGVGGVADGGEREAHRLELRGDGVGLAGIDPAEDQDREPVQAARKGHGPQVDRRGRGHVDRGADRLGRRGRPGPGRATPRRGRRSSASGLRPRSRRR